MLCGAHENRSFLISFIVYVCYSTVLMHSVAGSRHVVVRELMVRNKFLSWHPQAE